MKRQIRKILFAGFILLGLVIAGPVIQNTSAVTFDSGSTCVDLLASTCSGTFSPTVNTIVQLPPDGILDYTTYYIPAGVTVSYARNAANTPVIIRTTGDVKIEGVINVSATTPPTNSGMYGDGNLGDDGQPGLGGPGGGDGGYGGYAALFGGAYLQMGGNGQGLGGGPAAGLCTAYNGACNGAGGGFGTGGVGATYGVGGGSTYGQATLLPIVGGSGGSGGAAGTSFSGAGGGGGGGAILISAGTPSTPATITLGKSGTYAYIYADGGAGGHSSGSGCGGCGGGGSGGAIRLVANALSCPGTYCRMYARGGSGWGDCSYNSGGGGKGIIRLESNTISGWDPSYSDPNYTWSLPGHAMVPNNPTLVISSVTPTSGVPSPVPANPTGNADITFPQGTTTVTVNLAATNIPIGTTIKVYVVPASGATRSVANSSALAGASDAATTATATITLSPGNNVLLASATYSVTELIALNLPTFDDGVRVAKIRVDSTMGGESKITYITASGKEYPADSPHRDKPKKG